MNINARVPVGVLGASGYVGQELLRLLAGHPGATVAFATAESAAGERRDGIALVRIEDAPLARAEVVLSACRTACRRATCRRLGAWASARWICQPTSACPPTQCT